VVILANLRYNLREPELYIALFCALYITQNEYKITVSNDGNKMRFQAPPKGVILTGPGSVWFDLVRNPSDFDSSDSVNGKRVYGSVCDQSEPSS